MDTGGPACDAEIWPYCSVQDNHIPTYHIRMSVGKEKVYNWEIWDYHCAVWLEVNVASWFSAFLLLLSMLSATFFCFVLCLTACLGCKPYFNTQSAYQHYWRQGCAISLLGRQPVLQKSCYFYPILHEGIRSKHKLSHGTNGRQKTGNTVADKRPLYFNQSFLSFASSRLFPAWL